MNCARSTKARYLFSALATTRKLVRQLLFTLQQRLDLAGLSGNRGLKKGDEVGLEERMGRV